jgi:hypothetical protein
MQIDAFSSAASIVHFYRMKMGHIENAERAEIFYFYEQLRWFFYTLIRPIP